MAISESFKTVLREHRGAVVLFSLALLAAAWLLVRTVYGARMDAYAVVRGDIVQTLVASGRVETPSRVDIGSQITGTVASIPVEEGQVVKAGQLLIALEDSEARAAVAQARAAVAQAQTRLRQLQEALASADAFPDQRFASMVVYINPAVDPQRGSLEVKLDVPQPPDYLRQDMTVSVDIEVERHPNAVTVPLAAVRDSSGKTPWVMKVVDGRAVRQAVKLGVRGGAQVEVVSGLQPGDLVLPATAAGLSEGRHVRAKPAGGSAISGS